MSFVFPGAEIRLHSQWNLGAFFPILKKISIFKKKKFFFLKIEISFQSTHTQASYMVTFSFNLMAIVYVIANLFLLTKNGIIVHYNTFPNLGVCHANFPNLKGLRAPSQNCKKSLWTFPDLKSQTLPLSSFNT